MASKWGLTSPQWPVPWHSSSLLCCRTRNHCETKAFCIAATQAPVHFCFIQHHQQCKTPGLLLCQGMKEDDNWRNHSESPAESLNAWDIGSKVKTETEPEWLGNPEVLLHPLEGMQSAGGWVFQTFEDYKDIKLLHGITQEEWQSSAQVDMRGRWYQGQVAVSDLQRDTTKNFAIGKGNKFLRRKKLNFTFFCFKK